jgi:hypothetical protein
VLDLGKLVTSGVKGALGLGAKPAAKAGTKAAATAAGKLGIKGTVGKLPIASLFTGAAFGGMRLAQGDTTGAAMEAASAISATLPGWGTALSYTIDAAIVGRDFGAFKGTAFEKKEPGAKPTKPAAKTKPANAKKPSASTLKMPTAASQSAATTMSAETTSTVQLEVTPAQTQSPQTSLPNIGPAPQAQPNVVMISSMAGGQPQEPQMTSSGGAASDVPAISSSNPSNFYTLYSQVNYNVVM